MQSLLARDDSFDEHDGRRGQPAAVDRVQAAARLYGTTGNDGPLRDATRALAADAATRGMRAEELVIAFKQLWTTMPELSPLRRHSRAVVDELVTLCINEFYRHREGASR